MKRCWEKYLLELVEIHPKNWMLVIVVLLANSARSQSISAFDCSSKENSQWDSSCLGIKNLYIFGVCGGGMLAFTILLATISRFYELRLLANYGINSSKDYAAYLQVLSTITL